MKLMFAVLISMITAAAGQEITLRKDREHEFSHYEVEFKANPALERAWVELVSENPGMYDGDWSDEKRERFKLDELSYRDGQIIYNRDGVETVCAEDVVHGRWIFTRTVMMPTGNCRLEKVRALEEHDDGFHIVSRRFLYLNLLID